MRRFGVGLVAAAMLLGAVLAWLKAPTVVALGLVGIAFAVAYSLPPLKLASRGLGEATVAVGLGALPVMGAAWLQTGVFDVAALRIAVPTSMWVTAILLINEVPDLRADSLAGKHTLPVRFGIDAPSGAGRETLRGSIEKTLGIHAIGSLWIAVCAWFGG